MNKAKLKSYAPAARRDFIQAVTQRANLLGLSATGVAPIQITGDIAMINGRPWPAKVAQQRELLVARIKQQGFDAVMEAEAYGWFNRFAALRFMELHGYLDHGYRVLSNQNGVLPEILDNAANLDVSTLPGLDRDEVIRLKLDGNKDNELYRLLLTTQCNALASSMGFLFEKLGDETELLLPDNLLNTDSVIAKLVQAIPEEDWAEVEIIGWLYQFYISEKKDQVIGKVVKSEDIPAATQLFTPNWIVQYLVQNSVGRLWLMANPASTLASQWPYYIQPAEQTPEVQAQLDALIQTRMDEDGGSLNPETITVLDPACGSGHILVVAYDVLKAIYLERGYQARAIPRLILEKNLFGLDIDDRAAQMAGFALLMKARADDRRLFNEPPKLNVLSLQESKGLDAAALAQALQPGRYSREGGNPVANDFTANDLFPGTRPQMILGDSALSHRQDVNDVGSTLETIQWLIDTFEHAKTFGSLIQIGLLRTSVVREMLSIVEQALQSGDLYARAAAQDVLPLVRQALVLGVQFDAVVANPPYMGGKGMNPELKEFAKQNFPANKADLFAMFIDRGFIFSKEFGFNCMVTMQSWMFLSSFEEMREEILKVRTISNFAHIGYNSFPELNSKIAQACVFNIFAKNINGFNCRYLDLNSASPSADKNQIFLRRSSELIHTVCQDDFHKIPGSPLAYWISERIRNCFVMGTPIEEKAKPRQGMATTNNQLFLRLWHEVAIDRVGFGFSTREHAIESKRKWFPYNKGGEYRKWYGNNFYLVNFEDDGKTICEYIDNTPGVKVGSNGRVINREFYFQPGITWSFVSWSFGVRKTDPGFIFDIGGSTAFPESSDINLFTGLLCSKISTLFMAALNPTLNFQVGNIGSIPIIDSGDVNFRKAINEIVDVAVQTSRSDWDSFETSWDFLNLTLTKNSESRNLESSWADWERLCIHRIDKVKNLEEENNRLFINSYGLQDELSASVPYEEITLVSADREKDCQRLISYAIGCMMGRYSLDEPGLIYAHSRNVGFDASRYASFPADADGIVPLTDELWFTDDAANRVREFLLAVWGADTLEENMAWLAESLGKKSTGGASETPDETIRRYLADKFFKDHLQTYKKRPIYWLFSSGKQGAFQALVYLHRYNEGTLARMRNEYVIPLAGKFGGRADLLQNLITAASTTSERSKLQKELDSLKKKQLELNQFDEQLRHYADQRISLDLDDGVKVNYGKFGNLLAEVKAITGGKDDE